jgi:3-oxoacyl-[acyl-carrier protein] reductase
VISNIGNGSGSQNPIPNEEEWDFLWQTNFSSSFNTAKVFIPELKKSNGNLIFVSSIAGIQSLGAPITYSTSKSALISFSKDLSIKLAPIIRVNVVAPGNIFFKDGTWDKKLKVNPEQVKQMLSEKVPLKRFGNPEEVADLILFVSSEKAKFITGSCFVIDGGQTTNF